MDHTSLARRSDSQVPSGGLFGGPGREDRERREKPRVPAAAAVFVVVRRRGGGRVTQGVRLMSRHLLTTAAGKEAAGELKPAV